jgi:hypothetical protein
MATPTSAPPIDSKRFPFIVLLLGWQSGYDGPPRGCSGEGAACIAFVGPADRCMLSCRPVGAIPNPGQGPLSMASGCLAIVAVCAGLGFAVLHYLPLPPSGDPTVPRIFAVLIGSIGGLGLASTWSILTGRAGGSEGRSALYARARTEAPPEEGRPVVATGVVRTDRPLTSPIGGVACAAYDFVMFTEGSSRGKPTRTPVYWGYAGNPFFVDGRSRRYPVSGVPMLGWKQTRFDDAASRARARAYVRATGWETVEYGTLGAIDTVFQRVGIGAMAHGRKDFGLAFDSAPDVALLALEERVLPIGAQVSAFGTWSGGAIAAPPSPLPASFVVVGQGGPESLDGQPGVPHSTVATVAGALVMLGLAAGLFWFATEIMPTVGG